MADPVMCQSLVAHDKPCPDIAVCIVRERSPDRFIQSLGWSGRHCKRCAIRVVQSHWHHVPKGPGIEIIPMQDRR